VKSTANRKALVLAEPNIKGTPFVVTALGISSALAKIPFDGWQDFGWKLRTVRDGLQWVAGDWLNFGEDAYGHDHAQALDPEQWEPKTLSNYANVCRAFPYARRRATLPFSHHAAVYVLPESVREGLLDDAERNGWSEKDLRTAAKEAKNGKVKVREHERMVPDEEETFEIVVIAHTTHKAEVFDRLDEMVGLGWIEGHTP